MLLRELAQYMPAWPPSVQLVNGMALAIGIGSLIYGSRCRSHPPPPELDPTSPTAKASHHPLPRALLGPEQDQRLLARAFPPTLYKGLALCELFLTVKFLLILGWLWWEGEATKTTITWGLVYIAIFITCHLAIHVILSLVIVVLGLKQNVLFVAGPFMLVNLLWSFFRLSPEGLPEDLPWTLWLVAANAAVCALWALYTVLFDRSRDVDPNLSLEAAGILDGIKADNLSLDARIAALVRHNVLLERQAGLSWAMARGVRKMAFISALHRTPSPGVPYHPKLLALHEECLQLSEEARPKDVSAAGFAFLFDNLTRLSRSMKQVEAEIQALPAVDTL